MKDLKANVGESLPKTFATFGAHSALAAAMIVPVSIAIQSVMCVKGCVIIATYACDTFII